MRLHHFSQARLQLHQHLQRLLLALVLLMAFLPWPARAEVPVSIDMKLLLISADGTEPVFAGFKSTLDQLGVPADGRGFDALAHALPAGTALPPPQGVFPRFVEEAE